MSGAGMCRASLAAAMTRSATRTRTIPMLSALVMVLGLGGCTQCSHGAKRPTEARRQIPADLPPISLTPASAARSGSNGQPTLVLDAARLAQIRDSAKRETAAWKRLRRLCDDQSQKPIKSGYQGWDWADAVANLSLCWHATSEPRYGRAAVSYVAAFLDDRFVRGDGKGGPDVVRHDSGYGIRTFGAYSALGYDWLRTAPGMTPELRKKIIARLEAWLAWYEKNGYLRDHPLANYFWGYFTTLSFAGLAVGNDSPMAEHWRNESRRLLETKILPTFQTHLRGGGWPEGWQYGSYVAVQAALVAEAYETRAGVPLAKQLPWFSELVQHKLHSLSPDRKSVYGGGTWGARPSRPSALSLSGAVLALEGLDDDRAAKARWLLDHAFPALTREQAWVALLIDQPAAPRKDPRAGEPLSRSFPGTGLTMMRSDWSKDAVWISFQAGPRLTPDHQHKDQGHFELTRGSDWLLVDSGDSEGGATSNHNCMLIDDGGKTITYSPNQGVWGTEVETTHYGDDGRVVGVVGEIGDAWAPSCVRHGCSTRAVERATRALVYVRPNLLVIEDRISLDNSEIGTTWAAHFTVAPALSGKRASATVGSSRVDLTLVAPGGTTFTAVREPHGSGTSPHAANRPWGPSWRLEAAAPRATPERRFVTWITTDAKHAAAPDAPTELTGSGLSGAVGASSGKQIAILFAERPEGGKLSLRSPPDSVVIAGLTPAKRYATKLTDERGCTLTIEASEQGDAATGGGFVRVDLNGCRRR
jgi:hypothetical protein